MALEASDIEWGRLTQQCYLRPTYTYAIAEHLIKRRLGRLDDDKLQAAINSLVLVLTK